MIVEMRSGWFRRSPTPTLAIRSSGRELATRVLVTVAALLSFLVSGAWAQGTPNDSLVTDSGVGMLFRVNGVSGARTLISDFRSPAQGPVGDTPVGLAVEAAGTILVTDTFAGTNMQGGLFRVDAATGARTLLSDFGNAAQGPTGNQAYDVAIEAAGTILVLDYFAATDGKGALFRVDPDTGDRTLLSDFGDDAQGPGGTKDPVGVAVEAAGTILIADYGAGTNFLGGLWRVDPVTGTRTLLSDFGNAAQGPTGENPVSVTVETTGAILVIDPDGGTSGRGALFRVDPGSGTRTLLSDFGDALQGPTGDDPYGVAVDAAGTILVSDLDAGTGRLGGLFRVDPSTGFRTLLSNFGEVSQGPLGLEVVRVATLASGVVVHSPNGGETWPIDSMQTIVWTSSGITGDVMIELSRDGGTSWEPIIASTPNDGSHPWTVTGPVTAQARVRITSLSSPTLADVSDGDATIVASSVTVHAPNGGQTWPIGSTQYVTWTSSGLTGNVKIEVSRNGGRDVDVDQRQHAE